MKNMDDKALLEDILLTTKGACDLYMHGTIESETANVHCTFDNALSDTLKMQNDIFSQMSQMQQAPQQQIDQVKQQFAQG